MLLIACEQYLFETQKYQIHFIYKYFIYTYTGTCESVICIHMYHIDILPMFVHIKSVCISMYHIYLCMLIRVFKVKLNVISCPRNSQDFLQILILVIQLHALPFYMFGREPNL